MTPTRPESNEKPKEKHIRIIYVPVEVVLADMQRDTLGTEPAGTVTLAHVAKHIGTPAPTDIVVFNKQPWHFAGHGTDQRLREHPRVHRDFPETVTVLKPGEEAVWTSDRNFQIVDAQPAGHAHPEFIEASGPFPRYPFANHPIVTREETHGRWVAHSGVAKTDAQQHMYKIIFSIETEDIDPDVYCSI